MMLPPTLRMFTPNIIHHFLFIVLFIYLRSTKCAANFHPVLVRPPSKCFMYLIVTIAYDLGALNIPSEKMWKWELEVHGY